jgi:hypothetical protein
MNSTGSRIEEFGTIYGEISAYFGLFAYIVVRFNSHCDIRLLSA